MTRPMMQYFDREDGTKGGLPFPKNEEWSSKQQQALYALQHFFHNFVVHHYSYIAYHYGECNEVIRFARFFSDFWESSGKFINESSNFDVIDEKFIEWVEIMQFEQSCDVLSMNFDKAFKRFMYYD